MSSEPFWERIDPNNEIPAEERALTDAMAGQNVSVSEAVDSWDSPGLYEIEGARDRCNEVLKKHRLIGVERHRYHAPTWDLLDQDVYFLPPFDPDDPSQAAVPRVIFAAYPKSVRICRGAFYNSLAGVLLSIAAKPSWLCDWGSFTKTGRKPGPHPISPIVWTDPETGNQETTHSLPYLMLKAMGDFLLVFVVCTQCLEDVIHRGQREWTYEPNDRDREYIDGQWKPRFFNPHKAWAGGVQITRWDTNDSELPTDHFGPAAYLRNGIRYVAPHRYSQWREFDDRTYDYLPDG